MEFVNAEGGLTAPGYVAAAAAALAALVLAVFLVGKSSRGKFDARKLSFCALSLALAFTLSFVKIIPLPTGGSVTLCSMLFIVLMGYWYGTGIGLLIGFVYGIMQFLQGPYVLSLLQVGCDYLFAFTCLGLGGLFRNKKGGLTAGYIVAILARGAFHSLGGYLFWMEYMPENFPQSLASLYPIIYNYGYILAEGVLTLILINLPAVKKAISRITEMAKK